MTENAEAQIVGGLADHGEVEMPFAEDGFGFGFLGGVEHHEHALLRFRQHHFVGCHALFAARDHIEIEFDAEIALGTHFDGRAGEAGGPHVLNGDDGTCGHQLKAGFEQQLFGEGVADLDGGAFFLCVLIEFGRCHGGAMDAVATCLGAEIDDGQAHALGFGIENLVRVGKASGESVYEAVAVIAFVEIDFAADGRHAKRIAIAANACNDAGDDVAGARMRRRTKAQRIHGGDGTRAHGEDVTQDAADACGRALIRLDVRWVVVAFHLEDDCLTIANIHDACIFAGAANDAGAGGGQRAQPFLGGFVRAMLVPHGREDAKFGQRRFATDEIEDALVFVGLQAMFGDKRGRNFHVVGTHATASSRLSKSARPRVPPFIASISFSGWGIRPMTLPRSFMMPAILLSEPLGFVPSA